MTQLDITDWSDFVRGVTTPETESRLRKQLENPSPSDARTIAVLQRVAETGRSDIENAVPAPAVRIAKALASCPRKTSANPSTPMSLLRRLRCAITFDSQLQPAPVGSRNLATDSRQLVMETEGYRIDIQLEHEQEPRGTSAVGQVMSAGDRGKGFSGIPVLIFSGSKEINQTLTSSFGEFQFEGLPRENLELCIVVGEDFLEVPLPIDHATNAEETS